MKIYSTAYLKNKIFCVLLMLLCFVCIAASAITAKAAKTSFIIDADLLPSDRDAYNLQMTIENQGSDWEGIVRIEVCGDYDTYYETVYDTTIVLPEGSVKQFVVKIPILEKSTDRLANTIRVSLYDSKLNKSDEKIFKYILSTDGEYRRGERNNFITSMLEYFGNGIGRLNFNTLSVIVVIYVFFAGPILYLILRFIKKRDLYWISVVVTSVVAIFAVYMAGRGYEVVNTKVYSVTVRNLDEQYGDITFMHCYDAGHNEWSLKLAQQYECAGVLSNKYNYSDNDAYHNRILKDGDIISFGADPDEGFEDCYFQASTGQSTTDGNTSAGIDFNVDDTYYSITGEVENKTSHDFKYFAVCSSHFIAIYKELPAGGKCELTPENSVFFSRNVNQELPRTYTRDVMFDVCDDDTLSRDIDVLSALGMGVIEADYSIDSDDKLFVVGVVENWDKAVDDNCSETAYGCLYSGK